MYDVDIFIDTLIRSNVKIEHGELSEFDLFLEQFNKELDPVDAFLEHHGVKGQKWGVRKNRTLSPKQTGVYGLKKTAYSPRRFSKTPGRRSAGHVPVNLRERIIYREVGRTVLRKDIPRLHKSDKYRGKDLNKDAKLKKEYQKDVEKAFQSRLDNQFKSISTIGRRGVKFKESVGDVAGLAAFGWVRPF